MHVVEYARLRSCAQTLPYMRLSMRLYREAREAEGYYAGGIRAQWWSGKFYSYTVWDDRDAMLAFPGSAAHPDADARAMRFAAPGSCYVEFVSDAPPDWEAAQARLAFPTKYFVPPFGGDLRNR